MILNYKNSLPPTRSSTVYKALSHALLLTVSVQDSEEGALFPLAEKTEALNVLPQITSTHTYGPVPPSPVLQGRPQRGLEMGTTQAQLCSCPPPFNSVWNEEGDTGHNRRGAGKCLRSWQEQERGFLGSRHFL